MTEYKRPEPNDVFRFFEEIAKIPHGSYNTTAISNYLADFAKASFDQLKETEHHVSQLASDWDYHSDTSSPLCVQLRKNDDSGKI